MAKTKPKNKHLKRKGATNKNRKAKGTSLADFKLHYEDITSKKKPTFKHRPLKYSKSFKEHYLSIKKKIEGFIWH